MIDTALVRENRAVLRRRPATSGRALALQKPTYLVLLFCLAVTALPRVIHPAIRENLSGLDLVPPILVLWLCVLFFVRQRFVWPKGLLLWIAILPVIMLLSTVFGFLTFGDDESLRRGVLQAIRRTPAALFALTISQVVLTSLQATRLVKTFVLALVAGGILFYVVEAYEPFGFGNRSRLSGNFLTEDTDELEPTEESESNGMLMRVREAGNVGSATVYGLLCGVGMVLTAELIRTRRMNYFFGGSVYLILGAGMMASGAKAAIAAAAVAQLIMFILFKRLRPLALVIAIILVAALAGPFLTDLIENMSARSQSSMGGRWEKYDRAFTLVNDEPIRVLVGHGWRSLNVGWHSEIVEVLMSYGLLFGAAMLVVIYLYFPYRFVRLSRSTDHFSRAALILIYVQTAISSLFQDLFQDPSVVLMFAVVIGVAMRTAPTVNPSFGAVNAPQPLNLRPRST